MALSCAALDRCFPDEGWDAVAHRYLSRAVEDAERSEPPPGMFGGVAGLAFAAWSLSHEGTRYQRLLTSLDQALEAHVVAWGGRMAAVGSGGVPFGDFDLISGLAGVGAYLLCRPAGATLTQVLTTLVALSEEVAGRPRWWNPARLMGDEDMAVHYPDGIVNFGLAHGIPGPLALMSLALSLGVEVPGLPDAISRSTAWLVDHRADDEWGPNWPVAVRLTTAGLPSADEPAPSRTAWCYGSPGVARALWLAGSALGRSDWCSLGVSAMEAVYRRPLWARRIDSPTFCHGIAGLLQVTLRFAHDTGLPSFSDAAATLTDQILSTFEPERPLGFRDIEPDGRQIDQPGLLDGAPGVMLALLAAGGECEPTWDRAFLLA